MNGQERQRLTPEEAEELREQVYRALNHSYPPFRELLLPIAVQIDGDEVVLQGWVPTLTLKRIATRLAQEVPGVTRVRNELIADEELERKAAEVLEQEPALEDDFPGIHIDVIAGAVTLWGTVSSEADRQRAEALVRQIPGVRKVVNQLKVRGDAQ